MTASAEHPAEDAVLPEEHLEQAVGGGFGDLRGLAARIGGRLSAGSMGSAHSTGQHLIQIDRSGVDQLGETE